MPSSLRVIGGDKFEQSGLLHHLIAYSMPRGRPQAKSVPEEKTQPSKPNTRREAPAKQALVKLKRAPVSLRGRKKMEGNEEQNSRKRKLQNDAIDGG